MTQLPISDRVERISRLIPDRVVYSSGLDQHSPSAKTELARFLLLCATSNVSLTPSPLVDELWHEFVLDTLSYSKFCTSELHVFVHHVPADAPCREKYKLTRKLLISAFGNADPIFWPELEDCETSKCSSCTNCGSQCSSEVHPPSRIPELTI
jgi:hypothetical protein